MTLTLKYTGELRITSCWCGIVMALPQDLYDYVSQDRKRSAFCPLGHEWVVGDSVRDRMRREADEKDRALTAARAGIQAARDQAHAAERSAAAYRGHLTRLRKRIANGVCPVAGCHRHFDQVQAHIETQHPDWLAAHPEALT